MTPIAFLPKIRSNAIMASAAGQPCALRLPMVCSHNAATTVMAHLPGGGSGQGTKGSDIHGVFACSACHDVLDRRTKPPAMLTNTMILDAMLRGHAETQARWVEMGLLTVPGATII